MLGRKVHTSSLTISSRLSNNPHRLLLSLRPPIPPHPRRLLQHAPSNPHGTRRQEIHPPMQRRGPSSASMDRQQRRKNGMVYPTRHRWRLDRRPQKIPRSLQTVRRQRRGEAIESGHLDRCRARLAHGFHLWLLIQEPFRYQKGRSVGRGCASC